MLHGGPFAEMGDYSSIEGADELSNIKTFTGVSLVGVRDASGRSGDQVSGEPRYGDTVA